MVNILLVALGGSVGSILRFLVSGWVQSALGHPTVPNGTLVVNLAGCLAIGGLAGFFETRQVFNAETRVFLFVGLLGGFTTFSAFGYETLSMLRSGEGAAALGNVALHIILGLVAVWLGYVVSRNLAGAM